MFKHIIFKQVEILNKKKSAYRFLDLKDFPNNTLFKIETTLHSENDLMKLITIITSQTKILEKQDFANEITNISKNIPL